MQCVSCEEKSMNYDPGASTWGGQAVNNLGVPYFLDLTPGLG